eukprot:TRINITY_DN68061_c0_g1_i1.p1 TRINITY_DN68061_c0_g1~~TRINITY_DN68061_c0_g1_i1.p1  ORF type:complete len:306 (-),score=79.79 TRINITY_DN68061_c0_g1_i1:7-924(-)
MSPLKAASLGLEPEHHSSCSSSSFYDGGQAADNGFDTRWSGLGSRSAYRAVGKPSADAFLGDAAAPFAAAGRPRSTGETGVRAFSAFLGSVDQARLQGLVHRRNSLLQTADASCDTGLAKAGRIEITTPSLLIGGSSASLRLKAPSPLRLQTAFAEKEGVIEWCKENPVLALGLGSVGLSIAGAVCRYTCLAAGGALVMYNLGFLGGAEEETGGASSSTDAHRQDAGAAEEEDKSDDWLGLGGLGLGGIFGGGGGEGEGSGGAAASSGDRPDRGEAGQNERRNREAEGEEEEEEEAEEEGDCEQQ